MAISSMLNSLKGSESNQGSISNGVSSAQAQNQSYSQTDAASARQFSEEQARVAYERQKELMKMEMDFNREEAEKARKYNTEMANTVYTRSVNNMKEAGINPILAAGMGLSGASVGSAQTASIGGASAPMAQSFMDTTSASSGSSESYGENHGSSWGHSESGLATGLALLGDAISGAIGKITSGQKIEIALNGLKDVFNTKDVNKSYESLANTVAEVTGQSKKKVNNVLMTKSSDKYKAITNAMKKNNPALYKSPKRINESSWGK